MNVLTANAPEGHCILIELDSVSSQDIQPWMTTLPSELRSAHAKRQREWLVARLALQKASSLCGHESPDELRFSISHDDRYSGAWVTKSQKSIGFDFESLHRQVSPVAAKRMYCEGDIDLPPIKTWSAKEAAFKSVPSQQQEGLTVSQLILQRETFSLAKSPRTVGHWRQREEFELILSFAWM